MDQPRDPGTVAFRGRRILSMDPMRPAPQVVVVAGDRIVATGDLGLLGAHPGARVVDLGERWLLPGFVDAHNHLSIAAMHPVWADLSGARDLDEVGRRLRAQADREPTARWVRGVGWNEAEHGLTLERADLDALGIDRPVIVAHVTLHQCVVSSLGLDELGIGRSTRSPEGGEIVRGGDGAPSGLLVERAWSRAHELSLAAYRDPDRRADLVEARARQLLRDGITCVHDAACPPSGEAVYAALARERRLPISVLAMPHPEALLGPPDHSRLEGPPTGSGDEILRVGCMKLFADGGVAPAIDVCLGGTRLTYGTRMPGVAEGARAALERGFGVAVHAIGNAGLAAALDAFREADGARGRAAGPVRLRVEHAMLASPDQLAAMASLDVVAVVQPGFVETIGDSVRGVAFDDARWLPFASIVRAGVRIAASSDDPCAFHEPLLTSARGATRRCPSGELVFPEEAVPYLDWLRAYTAGAAWAGGQENERGRLAPGLRADLVVLDGDLDAENPPTVAETWVGGAPVFRAEPAPAGT